MKSEAAVLEGPRQLRLTTIDVNEDVDDDRALLRVEANGMCGSDYDQYTGRLATNYPLVAGHEIVGRIEAIGAQAAARWGVGPRDRVAVKTIVSCESCVACRNGRPTACVSRMMYGMSPMREGIVGGYSRLIGLHPNTRLYPIPESLSSEDAVLFNPLGAGFDWAVRQAGTQPEDSVVVFGPGQRGLACIVAAAKAGASTIVAVGRSRRPWKLDLARELGATHVLESDRVDVVESVREITGGEMADRAIDTTPLAVDSIVAAVRVVHDEATVVLAGLKYAKGIPDLEPDLLMRRAITLKGVFSVSDWARQEAIRLLASPGVDLSRLHTHRFGLAALELACKIVGGEIPTEEALHVTIRADL